MGEMLLCRLTDARATLAFAPLRGFRQKLMGLLGTRCDSPPVALCDCSSVHTFGMGYDIDVALVTHNGRVVASKQHVPPGRIVRAPGAWYALERPASTDPWPHVGSWLGIALTSSATKETKATKAIAREDDHARG